MSEPIPALRSAANPSLPTPALPSCQGRRLVQVSRYPSRRVARYRLTATAQVARQVTCRPMAVCVTGSKVCRQDRVPSAGERSPNVITWSPSVARGTSTAACGAASVVSRWTGIELASFTTEISSVVKTTTGWYNGFCSLRFVPEAHPA
jgi:hypothetical protein